MSADSENSLLVRSKAFNDGGSIPPKYTCDGENISPPIEITDYPPTTKSIAIIVEDPDAPRGTYDHWIVWNLPPNMLIEEDSRVGVVGTNSFGKAGYGGPCPPSGSHRYFFKAFALDQELGIETGSNKKALQDAMKEHVLASGELMGVYQREK